MGSSMMSLSTKWIVFAALIACLPSALGFPMEVGKSFIDEVQRNKRATVKATFKNGTEGSDYCNCECNAGCKASCDICGKPKGPPPCLTCGGGPPDPPMPMPEPPMPPPIIVEPPPPIIYEPMPEPPGPEPPGSCSACAPPPPAPTCNLCG